MCQLCQGRVLDIAVTDPCGENKKRRPVVVLTDTNELAVAREFVVAAISTKFSDPLPPACVLLPWSPDGKARSGLTEPCVVKCRWLRRVTREDILSFRGWLPGTVMRDIMRMVCRS